MQSPLNCSLQILWSLPCSHQFEKVGWKVESDQRAAYLLGLRTRKWWEQLARAEACKLMVNYPNHCIFRISSDFRHIFSKHSIYVGTVLPEESHRAECISVHLIHKRVCVFWQTCCENYNFIILWHYLQKVIYSWSLLYKDVAYVSFNVDWDYVVRVFYLVKLTVNESFIQIKH